MKKHYIPPPPNYTPSGCTILVEIIGVIVVAAGIAWMTTSGWRALQEWWLQ